MVTLTSQGVYLRNGSPLSPAEAAAQGAPAPAKAAGGTMAAGILAAHDQGAGDGVLRLTFDALTSHDITYVSVIQTAKASGLTTFPVPYVLTNCHNSLCAVGVSFHEHFKQLVK